ncbi:ComEA family DNA-binding protein [Actinokineospora sp. NBRC 105648]|uniref:ComEA family DNA-binding protein n=1 Tax=Actinokineospora sp. NBRC 105648 TaxID=3032206 RepID=UPI0024A02EA5|nr:ComEA family DNA-binding protein [Actinokineospora sp. NBRC 105648]GLZ39657.1 competence protein ComEA [Actinokineospora sp. NBRC 105648]
MAETDHPTQSDRASHMDAVLSRLVTIAGRPWDGVEDPPEPRPRLLARLRRPPTPAVDPPPDDGPVDTAGPLSRRWTPGRRRRVPIWLMAGLAAVAAVVTGFVALSGAPAKEPPPSLAAATVDQPGPSAPAAIVVDVVGKVPNPGLRTLPDGARVDDAIRASGGALPGTDLTSLNLARRLVDGEQVHVGVPAPVAEPPPGQPGGRVNLNLASLSQLDTLPGVGGVTAQRILDWRTKHGRFTRVEQLREVDGIGPARFETLRALVSVR